MPSPRSRALVAIRSATSHGHARNLGAEPHPLRLSFHTVLAIRLNARTNVPHLIHRTSRTIVTKQAEQRYGLPSLCRPGGVQRAQDALPRVPGGHVVRGRGLALRPLWLPPL